jgi:hypothetical protein
MTIYTFQPHDVSGGLDTFISSKNTSTNYGTINQLIIGTYLEKIGYVYYTRINRALIKFDLSSIPASSTVLSATLSLWTAVDYANMDSTLTVYRQLKDWAEAEVTWNDYKTGNAWTAAGGFDASDCEQTNIGSILVSEAESLDTEIQISLTPSKVEEWIDGTLTNNGMLICGLPETALPTDDSRWAYHSSYATTAGYRPKLVIETTADVQNMQHLHYTNNLALTQHNVLVVNNTSHLHVAPPLALRGTSTLAVFLNGLRLSASDFTMTGASSFSLNVAPKVGDKLWVCYRRT